MSQSLWLAWKIDCGLPWYCLWHKIMELTLRWLCCHYILYISMTAEQTLGYLSVLVQILHVVEHMNMLCSGHVCVPYSKPPQEAIGAYGGWAAVSLPPSVVLLWGWHEDHDHQPLLPQNSPHHGLTNAHHRGKDTHRCFRALRVTVKREKRIAAFSNLTIWECSMFFSAGKVFHTANLVMHGQWSIFI